MQHSEVNGRSPSQVLPVRAGCLITRSDESSEYVEGNSGRSFLTGSLQIAFVRSARPPQKRGDIRARQYIDPKRRNLADPAEHLLILHEPFDQ